MTLRCALYARSSSDQQRAASIEDQFRICREHAAREGWKIAGAYRDAAVSGDSVILRPGVQALLEDARRGVFGTVVAEALDRVSRDQADVALLYKHLRCAGGMIVTLSEGALNELHVGLKGTMHALFLKDLAAKTHRGLRGRVEAGKSGGGICYGYDVVKSVDAAGEPIRGEREIKEAEAEIVRRIFREFAQGTQPARQRPAAQRRGHPRCQGQAVERLRAARPGQARHGAAPQRALDRPAGVEPPAFPEEPGPRHAGCAPQPARGMDRRRGARAPYPGRRTVAGREGPAGGACGERRPRHRGDAQRPRQPDERGPPAALPALRPARMRRLRRPLRDARPGPLRLLQPRHDGLVRQRQEHPAPRIEERVLAGLTDKLRAPEAAAEAMRAYVEETNRLNRERRASGATDRKELAEIEKKIRAMGAVIEDGGYARGMMDRLRELEARQDELNERRAAVPADIPDIPPNIAIVYRRKVERLAEALADPRDRDEAAEAIRGLIERIVPTPGGKRGEMHAALHGDLGTILEWAGSAKGKRVTDTPQHGVSVSVVAGARNVFCYNLGSVLPLPVGCDVENTHQIAA